MTACPYTDAEADWIAGIIPPDDRCGAGRNGVHCPALGDTPRLQRRGFENIRIERVRSEEGFCFLVPIYPDGTKGRGFRCTDGSAAHQIGKLRIES